jgi:type IV pilus assembly protein PilQ
VKKILAVPLAAAVAFQPLASFAQTQPEEPMMPARAPAPPSTSVTPVEQEPTVPGAPGLPPVAEAAPAAPERAGTRIEGMRSVGGLVQSLSKEPVDFDFKDADLLGILRTFAAKTNRNIIAGPGVSGKVNLRLKQVPFDDAFRILLEQMGLVAIQKSGNIIEVARASTLPNLVEIFPLRYRFAAEVQKTVVEMLRDFRGDRMPIISVALASNSLIVTANNEVLHQIRQLIEQIDFSSPQISVKARLIEVGAGNSLNTGVTWAAASKFDDGKGTVRTMNNMTNFTIDPAGTNSGGAPANVDVRLAPTFFPTGGILDISTVMNKTRVYALLNALMSDSRTKTISEPTVMTGNYKSAKIHVGQNLPVRTSQVTQTATTQSIQYIPEGVDLEVTPVVSPASDVINFRIRVGVSELVGFQDNNPITTERTATTEVSVKSGDTVIIGGLMREKTTDIDTGIPILMHIPILGWLFKSKRKSKEKTELLIFITPEIVNRTAKL